MDLEKRVEDAVVDKRGRDRSLEYQTAAVCLGVVYAAALGCIVYETYKFAQYHF